MVIDQIKAPDAQRLIRKIYEAEGVNRETATLADRHAAQRLYKIERGNDGYIATRKAKA